MPHGENCPRNISHGAYCIHQLCSRGMPSLCPTQREDAPSSASSTPVPRTRPKVAPSPGWLHSTRMVWCHTVPPVINWAVQILSLWKMNEGALTELAYWSRMKKKKAGREDRRHRLSLSGNADSTTDRHTGQLPDGASSRWTLADWSKKEICEKDNRELTEALWLSLGCYYMP